LGGHDALGVDPELITNPGGGRQRFGIFAGFLGERFNRHAAVPSYVVRIVQGPRRVKTGNAGKINKLQKCIKYAHYFTLM
jgi:hypothetical protein